MPRLGSGVQRTSRTRRTIESNLRVWVGMSRDGSGIVIREGAMVVLAVLLLAAASVVSTAGTSEDVRRRLAAGQVVVTDCSRSSRA